jgi:hypothetical protein
MNTQLTPSTPADHAGVLANLSIRKKLLLHAAIPLLLWRAPAIRPPRSSTPPWR